MMNALLAVLLTLGSAAGQPSPASDASEKLIVEGFRLLASGESAKARLVFETALKDGELQNNPSVKGKAHAGLGQILLKAADYPAAKSEFESALALFDSIHDRRSAGRARARLATIASFMGENDRARELFEQAVAQLDTPDALHDKAETLQSFAFAGIASPEQNAAYLTEALDLARRTKDKVLEGQILHSQSDATFVAGDFEGAMAKLEAASQLFQEAGAESNLARALISMGRLYRIHGQAERALPLYVRALKIQEKSGEKQGSVQTLNAMGVAYDALGDTQAELEQYQKALNLALETGSPRLINFQRGALATALIATGKNAEAIALLEQVLAQPIEPYLAAYRYSNLGRAYHNTGQYEKAMAAFDKSKDLAKKTGTTDALLGVLGFRAATQIKLGRYGAALEEAREKIAEIDKLRAKLVPADFMKRGFNESVQSAYALAIDLEERQGDIESALLDAERARGRAFLDLLAGRNVQIKASERKELAELHALESDLKRQGVDPSRPAEPETAQPALRGGSPSDPVLERWKKSEWRLRSLVSAEPVSREQMTAIARRLNSTMLVYWVSEEKTFIWIVRPDGRLHAGHVDVTSSHLAELVRESWSGIGAAPARGEATGSITLPLRSGDSVVLETGAKKSWQELYRHLIEPVAEYLPAKKGSLLTIVPHGPLFRLSFAGLLDGRNEYLIEKYSLHYTPAISILAFVSERKHAEGGRRYLFVSNPHFAGGPGEAALADLPGSTREVQSIARLLPAKAVTVLDGAAASERAVRESAPGRSVIHLATHAIVRDDQVLDSFLALAGGDATTTNDGRLTAQEVYELDLAADLVVLSACRSGRGKVSGDGVAGLTRAFFYAGASTVLATLWDVADEPTSELIREFYQLLGRQREKSRALRDAQLSLLRKLRNGEVKVATPAGVVVLPEHPVLWASFVLQGQP